jgi:pilus assembly protein CpaB
MTTVKKRPRKALIFFMIASVVALLLAGIAISMTFNIISSVSTSAEQEKLKAQEDAKKAKDALEKLKVQTPGVTQRVVAQVEIPANTLITDTMVRAIPIEPSEAAPTDAITSPQYVIGHLSLAKIAAGSPLRRTDVDITNTTLPVPIGMRAVTVSVNDISGLNGDINPGSWVDVLTTATSEMRANAASGSGAPASGSKNKVTRTILQRVQVLSIAKPYLAINKDGNAAAAQGGGSNSKNSRVLSVTIAVTPGQAEKLVLGNTEGTIHLALRNGNDAEQNLLSGADMTSLLAGLDPLSPDKLPRPSAWDKLDNLPGPGDDLPSPSLSRKSSFTMEVYKADSKETKTFEGQ